MHSLFWAITINNNKSELEYKGNSKKYLRTVFRLILSINLLVLSNESSPDFDMTAQNTFVLQYQKLGMIQ